MQGMDTAPPLDRAASALGGRDRLTAALGISRRTFFLWKSSRIPAERVVEIERITGVARHELRPDLWPAEATP